MKLKTLPENQILDCLNCGSKINTSNTYCENCGQEIKDYRLSVWKLIKEVFSSIFNMDSKFFKTIFNIWRPVFLTKAYVKGERKSYLNPGRVFIISFFLFSAFLSFFMKSEIKDNIELGGQENLHASVLRQDIRHDYDSLTQVYKLEPIQFVDSLRYQMFLSKEKMAADSIAAPPSLFSYTNDEGVTVESGHREYKIATKDILDLSKEELFEKYKIEGLYQQVVFVQYLKFKENPTNWAIFMLTNSLWTIVLSTFVLALFMKLLYIRRFYYYVEHMILLMTFQSLIFMALSISLISGLINPDITKPILRFVWIFGSLWFIQSMKSYYKQSYLKTILKAFLILIAHSLILISCLLLVAGASFLLY